MKFKKFICAAVVCLLSLTICAADLSKVSNKPAKGTVALTFDDGPNPTFTPQILEILKKYNIKATFFMVGANAAKYPDMVKLVREQGHAVDSHSQTHAYLPKLNDKQLEYEVATPSKIIDKIIGIKPVCLRYPFGASNEHVREVIRQNGMLPTSMGYNSFDYDRPGVDKIVHNILDHAYPGMVVLMHDGYAKREQTVAALPLIIEGLKKKGYGFSTICMD